MHFLFKFAAAAAAAAVVGVVGFVRLTGSLTLVSPLQSVQQRPPLSGPVQPQSGRSYGFRCLVINR